MHIHAYTHQAKPGEERPRWDADRLDPGGALFDSSPFPPNFLAHWLRKPTPFIKGTWDNPEVAMEWAIKLYEKSYGSEEVLLKHSGVSLADRFSYGLDQLTMGNDVVLATNGLKGGGYREIYLICCPNAGGTARCPIGRTDKRPKGATVMTGIP